MEASGGGETLGYAYDALGRLLSETQGLGTVTYQYNPAGQRTRAFYPGDGNFSLAYIYDWSGAVTKICVKSTITNCKTETAPAVGFSYDDLGRRVSVMRGNGVETAWGYDGASRLASLAHDPAGTGDDQSWSFDHNPAGQIVAQTAALSGWGWTMGADTSEAYTANGLNQHLTVAGASVSHDARGNMTDDGLGRSFGYDAANRLTSVSGGASATLSYDPAGRLREVAGTATTRFLYDGADVIAEYDETDALLRRYVHGPGLDEPLIWYEGTGTANRRFLLADPRGSVVAVTDGAGDVTDINKYDDYGAPASTNIGRFQFTGQMWLEEAGLYHYKARAYHPALGRFMQTDPIGYGDGMNMYAYVGNDPVNARDPGGMCGTRLSVESSSAMCMLICANPADCYTDAELARLNGGEVGGGVGKIDNNTREMRRARFAAKLLGKAYQHFGENGLQAALWLLNNYRTVYYGFNGTAVGGVGVTGATGAFIDQDTGVSGQFVTIGFGVGANASFGFFFGAINRPWAALGGWYFQLEADIVAGSLGYVVGVDSCCMDGNFNPTATVNDARGAYVAVGPGAGVAATATYTWLDPDQ